MELYLPAGIEAHAALMQAIAAIASRTIAAATLIYAVRSLNAIRCQTEASIAMSKLVRLLVKLGFIVAMPLCAQTTQSDTGTIRDLTHQADIYLVPTGDLGAQINAAVAALGSSGGRIFLPLGTSLLWRTTATIPYSTISLIGRGPIATIANCSTAGDCLDIYPTHGASDGAAGEVANFKLSGMVGAGQSVIHGRDLIGWNLHDLELNAATASNASCMQLENYAYWTERNKIDHVNFGYECNIAMRFTINAADPNNSFGYNDIRVSMNPNGSQKGFSFENNGLLYNGTLTATINKGGVGATVIHLQDTFRWTNEVLNIRAEENGSAGLFWDMGASNVISASGSVYSDNIANSIHGSLSFENGGEWGADYTRGTFLQFGIPTDFHAGSTYLIPSYASSGYLQGIGIFGRYQYSSGNFLCLGDRVHNGCSFLLSDSVSGTTRLYAIPDTGGANNVISPASLGRYASWVFSSDGKFAVPKAQLNTALSNGAGLQIAIGTVCATTATPLNVCTASMSLPVTEPDTAYKVTGCTAAGTAATVTTGSVSSLTTTGFSVAVVGLTSTANSTGTLSCLVSH
jgi:hypothetical protein